MVDYKTFMERLQVYIEHELVPTVTGWQKWIFGMGAGILMQKADKVYASIKDNKILHTLDLIDGDNIDVDLLYNELIKQANKGPVTIEIPLLGNLTLHRQDVDTLYNYIKP